MKSESNLRALLNNSHHSSSINPSVHSSTQGNKSFFRTRNRDQQLRTQPDERSLQSTHSKDTISKLFDSKNTSRPTHTQTKSQLLMSFLAINSFYTQNQIQKSIPISELSLTKYNQLLDPSSKTIHIPLEQGNEIQKMRQIQKEEQRLKAIEEEAEKAQLNYKKPDEVQETDIPNKQPPVNMATSSATSVTSPTNATVSAPLEHPQPQVPQILDKKSDKNQKMELVFEDDSQEQEKGQTSQRHIKIPSIKGPFVSFDKIKEQNQKLLFLMSQNNTIHYTTNFNEQQYLLKHQFIKQDLNSSMPCLEISHNKSMMHNLRQSLQKTEKKDYQKIINQLEENNRILHCMPEIRQYPMIKQRKIFASEEHNSSPRYQKDGSLTDLNKSINPSPSKTQTDLASNPDINQLIEEDHTVILKDMSVYQLFWYEFEQNHWHPDFRQDPGLVVTDKTAYLFGGLGKDFYNQLCVLDLEQYIWEKIPLEEIQGQTPLGRYGHTMNLFQRHIVLFGGQCKSRYFNKQKEILNDVNFYDIDQKQWTPIKAQNIVEARQHHTASLVGRILLVNGGINGKEEILKNTQLFDLSTHEWSDPLIIDRNEPALMKHCCCSVFYPERRNKIYCYKKIEYQPQKGQNLIFQQGIYFFGGLSDNGEVYGDLQILKIDQKPFVFIRPETAGKPPQNRYGGQMVYNEKLNFVIIHGGKNLNDSMNYFYDTHIINIENLNWLQVEINGSFPQPVADFGMITYDSKLLTFGGLTEQGYASSKIQLLELENSISKQLMEEYSSQRSSKRRTKINTCIKVQNIPKNVELKQFLDNQNQQRLMLERLNFSNFKSFMPLPALALQRPYTFKFNLSPLQQQTTKIAQDVMPSPNIVVPIDDHTPTNQENFNYRNFRHEEKREVQPSSFKLNIFSTYLPDKTELVNKSMPILNVK